MRLQFGLSAFERLRGDLPELPVINMFAEEAPTEGAGVVLQSRSGLSDRSADMGIGPVEAIFKADGVLDGGLFGVSGGNFYDETAAQGVVTGDGPWSIAGYEDYVFAAGGGPLYSYDGTTLATVTVPDSANVTKCLVGASRLIILRADTEKFYWSDVLSTTIDALSFASAENQPDRLKDALFIDDVLILFGSETVEFWPNTTDADLPFQALEGRVFEKGVKATGCATKFGATFAWVTSDNEICVSDPGNIISKQGLEARIEASESVSLWTFHLEGTEFLALTLDSGTWVFSNRSKMWSKFASYGYDAWVPHCHAGGVFGSSQDGKTLAWGDTYLDLGGVLERRFRAGNPLNSASVNIGNLIVRANVGQTSYLTGTYADPTIEMRSSRDAGQTWGNWRGKSLGAQGKYRKKVQWTACGMFGQPGVLMEFRVTDPVAFRVSDVLVNEPFSGI